MSTFQKVYALHLAGYSEAEIEKELNMPKGKADFSILVHKLSWEVEFCGLL